MLQPELVAACMKAMGEAANGIPVTVKCRCVRGSSTQAALTQLCKPATAASRAVGWQLVRQAWGRSHRNLRCFVLFKWHGFQNYMPSSPHI